MRGVWRSFHSKQVSRAELEEALKGALREEIEYLERSGGERTVAAFGGTFLRQVAGWYLYNFLLEREFQIPDDSSAVVDIAGNREPANIVSIRGMELTLAFQSDHGPSIPRVEVSTDPSALLKRVLDRFEDSELPRREDGLARMAFGYASPHTGRTASRSRLPLTEEKRGAVEQALGSSIQFIWGPPGTGKTQTLAALCEILVETGESVLLASHTNIAVDEAMLRIAGPHGPLYNSPAYLAGKIIRLGPPRHPDLASIQELQAEAVAKRLGKGLEERLAEINVRLRQLEARSAGLRSVLDSWAKVTRQESNARSLEIAWGANIDATTRRETELLSARAREGDAQQRLDRASNARGLRRLIRRSLIRYERSLSDAELRREHAERALRVAQTDAQEVRVAFDSAKEQAEQIKSTLSLSQREAQSQMEMTEDESGKLKEERGQLEEKLSGLLAQVVREATLVGATMTKAAIDESISKRRFDTVIVDEASMAPLPLLYLLCLYASKRIVIVGDFRQLPPIVQSDGQLAQEWLGRDIFEQAGVAETRPAPGVSAFRADLMEQYRMAPEIRAFASDHFYGGHLTDGFETPREGDLFWVEQEPRGSSICMLDTSMLEAWSQRSPGRRPSKFNLYSALVSVEAAESLLNGASQPQTTSERRPIGIITPYRAQANLLRVLLEERGLARLVSVGTVHAFQGLENEVIIFDFVEDQPNWKAGPLLLEQGPRLINVAITRARHRLVVVGSYRHARQHLKHSKLWDLVEYAAAQQMISAEEFLASDYLRSVAEASAVIRHGEVEKLTEAHLRVCSERDFFAALDFDLARAQTQVVLFAPFLGRRVEDVIPRLRERQESGVDIYVVTPPLEDIDDSIRTWYETVHKRFASLGIRLIPFRKMHQKLVFIDDQILYVGGLNPLSHADTAEIMDRWDSKAVFEAHSDQVRLADLLSMWEDPADSNMRTCPRDGAPLLIVAPVTWQSFDPMFWGCSLWPECDYKRRFSTGPRRSGKRYCDKCSQVMRLRRTAATVWWVCANAPCGARRKVLEGEVSEAALRDLPPPPPPSTRSKAGTRRTTYGRSRRRRRRW